MRWWAQITHGDPNALALERRLRAFLDGEIASLQRRFGYCNAALDKLLAALGGWAPIGTRMRWPYEGVPEAVVRDLHPIARDQLPSSSRKYLPAWGAYALTDDDAGAR